MSHNDVYTTVAPAGCTDVLVALERARGAMVALVRESVWLSGNEVDQLLRASDEVASLIAGVRDLMRYGASTPPDGGDARAGTFLRISVQSALEALQRGDLETARERAEMAMWTARARPEHDLTWIVAIVLDLIGSAELDCPREDETEPALQR
jgi:hypothetical protein